MAMRKEDIREFQTARLKQLVSERAPGKLITFDEDHTMTVRFRIVDPATGTELVEAKGEWFPSELADKSDDEFWKLVQHLSNGKL
jgi:hypothetical protein